MGVEEGAGEGPRVQTATHPSAQTVTPLGDEVALGPIVRDGPRGGVSGHRISRNGFAVLTAASTAIASDPVRSAGRWTDRFGTHRASRFAAATTAGWAAE